MVMLHMEAAGNSFLLQRMICTALRTDEAGLTMSKYIREATEMMDRVSDAKSRGMALHLAMPADHSACSLAQSTGTTGLRTGRDSPPST
jgi:hypothetical protein